MAVIFIFLILLISLLMLWKGTDWMTGSLIPLARRMGTSYVAITTLLVSFMLSVPEIFTSLYSFLLGYPAIGVGVIIGSVMANIGLTIGISAAVRPLWVEKSVVIRDGIFMVIIAMVVFIFGADLAYQPGEGIILLLLFVPYAINVWYTERRKAHAQRNERLQQVQHNLTLFRLPGGFLRASSVSFFLGSAMLVVGSYLFSVSLVGITEAFRLPGLLVGITLGAVGPAIPNIAAGVEGTLKKFKDAAITETFGSNIFTLLVTLGLISLFGPLTIAARVFYFDLTWMIMLNLLLVALIFKGYHYKEASLMRYDGWLLLLFYIVLLVVQAVWF